ncbi:fibronectin type III domain-containing protein [Bacteroidota bacterium]
MKKLLYILTVKVVCFVLIQNFLSIDLIAQDLISRNSSEYPGNTSITPPGCTGATGNLCDPIELDSVARFNKEFIFTIPLLETGLINCAISDTNWVPSSMRKYTDLNNINCNEIHLTVDSGWSSLATDDHYIEFNFHCEKTGFTPDNQVFRINIIRDTAKIVMVIDRSGSMDWLIPPTSNRRWDTLEVAVNGFAAQLQEFRRPIDSLGLTYFASDVIQPNPANFSKDFNSITGKWFPTPTTATYVANELATVIKPQGWTAMGRGLLDAKRKLKQVYAPQTKKMVFLVTDGEQNWHELVDPDGVSVGGGVDYLNDYSTNPRDSIIYFTVATWEAGAQPAILNAIADNSGGEALHAVPYSSFQSWFTDQLVNMLHDCSPQLVLSKEADQLSGPVTYTFNLNKHIKKLLFQLSTHNIDITIKKDGVNMTPYAKPVAGSSLNFKKFSFPVNTGSGTIGSEGKWEVTLTNNSSKPYCLTALADDHNLDYTCKLNKKIFTVGDTIKFNTNISYAGTPITGPVNNVRAIVLKPNDDIGHLLSIYETSLCDTSNDDISSPVSQKYADLMLSDTTFYNALLPDSQQIVLTDLGDGNYTGEFRHTDISGPYNVLFVINGEIPNNGNFDRLKMLSSLVENDGSISEVDVSIDSEPPSTPSNLSVSNLTETSLKLKWDPTNDKFGIDKYLIFKDGLLLAEVNYNKCSYNMYNLAPGANYSFYVQARDASGFVSGNSNSVNVTMLGVYDIEAPTAPSNLSASDITQTQLFLSWNAANDNIGIESYEVYKNNIKIMSTTSTNEYILDLVAGTEYSFYVIAKDASGNISAASNALTISTEGVEDTEIPTTPTNLIASDLTHSSVYLSWNVSNDNVGVSEYALYENEVYLTSTDINEFYRSNLAPNTLYSYYVTAKDDAENVSANSNVINITTPGAPDTSPPSTPTNLSASNIGQTSLYLSWNESTDNIGVLLYQIFDKDENLIESTVDNFYSVTNLFAGTEYSFYVITKDAAGNKSEKSNMFEVSTLGNEDLEAPTAPTNVIASNIGQNYVNLKWNASADNNEVDKYIIYRNDDSLTITTNTSKIIFGLDANTNYEFYVVATDLADNKSDKSNILSVTTTQQIQLLSPPTNILVSGITQTSFKLKWNPSIDNAGNLVYGIILDGSLIDKTENTNYQVTGLNPSTTYKIHLIARDEKGNISEVSKGLKVTTLDKYIKPKEDFRKIVGIRIRPKSKFGYYMGPGFKSRINIEFKSKRKKEPISQKTSMINVPQIKTVRYSEPYLKNIRDNLDGSYYLIIGNVVPKTNPDINITVNDNSVYEGPLYRIPLWFKIIVLITILVILLLIILKQKRTGFFKFMWFILIVLLLIWILHYTGQFFFLYMI